MGKSKLKIFVVTNKNINSHIEDLLYKSIARQIYENESFQETLNPQNKSIELYKQSS